MSKNLRLLSFNLKIWQACGFLYINSYWKCSFLMIIPTFMNIFEILYLVENWGNIETVILSSFMTAILLNSIFRIVTVLVNQKDFVNFIQLIDEWLEEAENQNDTVALRIFNAVGIKADKFSKLSMFLGGIGAMMTIVVPILLNSKDLPYNAYIPGFDVSQSPCYEIAFGIQVVFVMPFILVTYIPFTSLFINYLMFGIGCLQILQHKLENVVDLSKSAEEIDSDLGSCIRYHIEIIRSRTRFSVTLSDLLSLTNLVEFLMFSLMLCVLLFFMLIVDSYMLQINAAIYIGSIFYVVLLTYWHANEFSYESLKVAEAAYKSDWTICNLKIKKSILILIGRSQNALEISAGGMYPMTLETFQSVLSASYSYFTVLNGMNK